MADSDTDQGGSDNEDESGFDPSPDLDKMTDKERKKWQKHRDKWRIFLDFLFRHVAIVTFRYNNFEEENMKHLMAALERAETIREGMKLKKGEVATITSFKVMRDAADMLVQHHCLPESNHLRHLLDIAGRLRAISAIAGGFYKALKKGKVRGLDKIKHYLDYWKGFCSRSFNFTELQFLNTDPTSFNQLERKYLAWPTTVRTALNLSGKFLKKASESTGLELLLPSQTKLMQHHMQAAEFVLATNIEAMLFEKLVSETKTFLSGRNPLVTPGLPSTAQPKFEMPNLDDVELSKVRPIPDNGVLMALPSEPPKDKKKGKKGKKGSGKKGGSASSHKPKKKKKK